MVTTRLPRHTMSERERPQSERRIPLERALRSIQPSNLVEGAVHKGHPKYFVFSEAKPHFSKDMMLLKANRQMS